MECKLRRVNFTRVSDRGRTLRPAFRATGISNDWYSSAMGVIVISLGTPQSARENFGCTWEHLGALVTSMGAPATSLDAPRIAVEQSGTIDIFVNVLGAPGNHWFYLLFNHCCNWWIQFVFSSVYLYSYPSTRYIGTGCWWCLRANSWWAWKSWSSKLRDTLRGHEELNLRMHPEIGIERVWRCTRGPWSCVLKAVIEQVGTYTWRP